MQEMREDTVGHDAVEPQAGVEGSANIVKLEGETLHVLAMRMASELRIAAEIAYQMRLRGKHGSMAMLTPERARGMAHLVEKLLEE